MKIRFQVQCLSIFLLAFITFNSFGCKKSGGSQETPVVPPPDTIVNTVHTLPNVSYWLTKSSQTALLQKQNVALTATVNSYATITVDTTQTYQPVDGFGYTLTGGSAYVINHNLSAADRNALLHELFGTDSASLGINFLRISIGSSDLDRFTFSYDDMPAGQTDTSLQHFSLANDETELIPLLHAILNINPYIKILATPWSSPVWMKDAASTKGGSLLPAYYNVYGAYFIKYIQAMQAQGISIYAVTPQNEPLNPYNNPSLYMTAEEEAAFIKTSLGPKFIAAGITTKIIAWDHNCDAYNYPIVVLSDADARQYIDGSAFHLYAGDISALSLVHNAYPDKNIYFTEQYTSSDGSFAGDLKWHLKNVIIGSMRNWSRNALEWNLANDESFGPHTDGGCTTCKGALTIGASVTRNVAYYIIAHASKFVQPGSVRVATSIPGSLYNVAFLRPDGHKVLIIENDGDAAASFNIACNGKQVAATLDAGDAGTYVW